jgi:prolyl-tRNA synthetase
VTHEPAITKMMKENISSYRDLPVFAYQFQTKFRNETRAKSGIMRTREFVMKDLYSFSRNESEHKEYYDRVRDAYIRIFERLEIGDSTYVTFASGGMFSKFSHEFQTLTDAGEDIIYIHNEKDIAINSEVFTEETIASLGLTNDFREAKSVEVGNIFTLGTRFSDALGLTYKNEEGENTPVFMGSYGIGPARVMGAIVEVRSDEKGIVWPKSVAPFALHLINLATDNEEVNRLANLLYDECCDRGIEVLYDERPNISAGEKFADSDLIGIPLRVVVSKKTLAEGKFETKDRATGEVIMQTKDELLSTFESL